MKCPLCILGFFLVAACSPKEPPKSPDIPRPVTVIELKETDPVQPLLLTGSVESWKEADISFEVEGQVRFIVEPGTNLEGRWVEGDEVRVPGDVLGRLDRVSYEIARGTAAAAVVVAKENLHTAKVELAKVLPASLKAAEASSVRADAEFLQIESLFKKGAAPEVDLIRARADRDGREANVEEAKAAIDAKKAEIKSLEAKVQEAEEQQRQAQFDLDRCTLHAPFSGEVSEVFIEAGGYARRGQRVAHLVMMQPIKIDLAVSAETAGRLRVGDLMRVYAPGLEEPGYGRVYEKATTADPDTRTFRISVMTRNDLARLPFPAGDPRSKLPRISRAIPLMRIMDEQGYIVEDRSLHKDERGYYVWADASKRHSDPVPEGTVFHLTKHRVTPGERRVSLQGLYLMRELTDIGDLRPLTLVPIEPPDPNADEQDVVIAKSQWRLHPGQLVPVLLSPKAPKPGLYLPIDAIRPLDNERGVVFLAQGGTAKRVEVRIVDRVGERFRIEGEGIAAGIKVITDYVHFLTDGESVRIIKRRES
ncbi:MAG: efflux RND transporter periplasmic adaptor subunit [Planctomycetota bacterium]|jgi:multidrug efflux pump subunit AcrA (membrane-fusion protein)